MRHHGHLLLQKKGTRGLTRRLPSPFAVAAVFLCLASSVGAEKLDKLDAENRCVAGKMDGIQQRQGAGTQYVTVAGGETMVKLQGTPKDTFRAMVRTAGQLDYELLVDYEELSKSKCQNVIEGLVKETKGCRLVEKLHGGKCGRGKCTGGRLGVTCSLSEVKQVQDGSDPTGYSLTDVTVWSSEECLSVTAKFANTDKNFCYLVESKVPNIHLKGTMTVREFTGRITTASTTETTTTGTTTEKTTTDETNTATEERSTRTTGENNTPAETTTADGTTETATQGTTAKPTNTDEPATGPTTKDPAGFRLAWYYWMIIAIAVVVVVLVGLGALAYFWHRHRRANRQKDEEELLGSDHKQSGSGESDGKSAEQKTKKAAEKEDAKDDGHEQVKSGLSHYFTKSASAAKSEVSGEKQQETTKATQRVSIIVPDSSSLSEAPEKKKSTTDGAENSKESGEKKEEIAKKEGTVQDNGYEVMGSTLLGAAGVGIPPTETATVSEVPAKKETTNDGYEKLDDVV